jgi:hypothetical protein
MNLRAPIVEDFAYLARRMRQDERDQFAAMVGSAYNPNAAAIAFISTPGMQFVLLGDDGLPVAAGGMEPSRPGVLDGWMIGTEDGWARHWRSITKTVRRIHDQALEAGEHRIQIIATAARTAAHDWYERGLGMRQEGVLRGYCADGSDAVMYARIKEATP